MDIRTPEQKTADEVAQKTKLETGARTESSQVTEAVKTIGERIKPIFTVRTGANKTYTFSQDVNTVQNLLEPIIKADIQKFEGKEGTYSVSKETVPAGPNAGKPVVVVKVTHPDGTTEQFGIDEGLEILKEEQ